MSTIKAKLGDVVRFLGGGTPSKKNLDYWGGPIPWATVKDIKGPILESTIDSITEEGLRNSASRLVPPGTVIIPTRMALGKAAITTRAMAINQDLKAAIPSESLNSRYLLHYFQSESETIERLGAGATVKGVTLDKLARLKIPLPPLNEQKRIAAVLDKADALRRQRQESLKLTEKLLQSAFIDMFGDPATNPKGWQLKELSALGSVDRGVSKHRPRNAPALLGGRYPLIQTGDVSKAGLYIRAFKQTYSELGFKQSKLWPKGTLCITIAANIAQTGILDFDACFPDSVVGFTPFEHSAKSIYVHFLFGFLQAMLEKNAPQAAQKNINLAILRTLQVPAPPFALQEEFERVVLKIMILNENQKNSLTLAEAAFSSIQQRAFRGELDLSKIVIPAADVEEEEDPMPLSLMEKLFPERYKKQGSFNAPQDIEAQLVALESEFNEGRIDYFPWSSDFFKYRTLSKVLNAPFNFEEIWYEAAHDMPDATYESVKDQVLEFLEQGVLEQRFDEGRKEIVFYPRA